MADVSPNPGAPGLSRTRVVTAMCAHVNGPEDCVLTFDPVTARLPCRQRPAAPVPRQRVDGLDGAAHLTTCPDCDRGRIPVRGTWLTCGTCDGRGTVFEPWAVPA